MRCHNILLAATAVVTSASAATELKVTVYEGPTECEDAEKVSSGNHLSMHYTGTIDESSETGTKGKEFDSSRGRGQTFDFQVGIGQVIKGWDDGLIGLCKGAKATIVIPPEMGYGESGAGGDIPGGATLNFDVEVVNINESDPGSQEEPPMPNHGRITITEEEINESDPGGQEDSPMPNVFEEIDTDGNGSLSSEEIDAYFVEKDAYFVKKRTTIPDAIRKNIWENMDKDNDGFVSWEEFPGPKGGSP